MAQAKRIAHVTNSSGVGIQINLQFGPDATERLQINYHNLWWSFICEPEAADANANGKWALILKKDVTAATPDIGDANIQNETFNQLIIACGVWAASNQTPYVFTEQLKSSRTLLAGEVLVLAVRLDGVTAGNVRTRLMMCSHTTAK